MMMMMEMNKVFHVGSFQLNLLFQKDQSNTKGEELPSLTNFLYLDFVGVTKCNAHMYPNFIL